MIANFIYLHAATRPLVNKYLLAVYDTWTYYKDLKKILSMLSQ